MVELNSLQNQNRSEAQESESNKIKLNKFEMNLQKVKQKKKIEFFLKQQSIERKLSNTTVKHWLLYQIREILF